MTDLTVNIEKIINAPIEIVFDAWLNPKMMSTFMMGMPGMPESDVETDAREGGNFTIIMHYRGEKLPHTGKYLEISRPDKLVFTWVSHLQYGFKGRAVQAADAAQFFLRSAPFLL